MDLKIIAIDAATNEKGEKVLIKAVEKSLKKHPDLELILVGTNELKGLESSRLFYEIAEKVIKPEDSNKEIIRKLKKSSTYRTAELVGENKADAGLSFANTKAVAPSVGKILFPLNGIKKIPLAIDVPSRNNGKYLPTTILDVGGTGIDDISPRNLLEFAILAKYKVEQRGVFIPKIGILSNGTEAQKGSELTRQASNLCKEYSRKTSLFEYIGFVEGREIFLEEHGKIKPDIVITDGVTGNILVKTAEGFSLLFAQTLKDSIRANLITHFSGGLAKIFGAFRYIKKNLHPDQYGGASFLGLTKPFIKGHGASNSFAIETAIDLTYNSISQTLNSEKIIESLRKIN